VVFVLQLVQRKALKLSSVRHFVLDECDKMLEVLVSLLAMSLLTRVFRSIVMCSPMF